MDKKSISFKNGQKIKDKIINLLDELKEINEYQVIIVETPDGTVDTNLGRALIYEGCNGEIVIDSE